VKRLLLLCVLPLVAFGCGGTSYSTVPSNHDRTLGDALRRLHAAGLRATCPTWKTPCGMGLPVVNVQTPRAPARVKRGSTVVLRFEFSPIPSAAVPKHHARWTHVPRLVGRDFDRAASELTGIWPCPHGPPARGTSATRLVVSAQRPGAGTRVPDYGYMTGRAYHPTTVDVTVAAHR
jgi:hypothetical protein